MKNTEIFIACDFENKKELYKFLSNFKDEKLNLKIGYQLFYKEGQKLIQELLEKKHNIFLDLKLHDIPTTLIKTIKTLSTLRISYLTIHLSSGYKALSEAKKIANKFNIKLLGVTLLTSLSNHDTKECFGNSNYLSILNNLINLAKKVKLFGIICSINDIPKIKNNLNNLKTFSPGIKNNDLINDHSRGTEIKNLNYNYLPNILIIGRKITKSENPKLTYQEIKKFLSNNKY